jgi:hypothetical protein
VLVFCSLLIVQFSFVFFFSMGVVSLPTGLYWFIPGLAGAIPCDAWGSPVGLSKVSQAGLKPASVGVGVLFSQCNVVWRNFAKGKDSGCQGFDSS